MYKTIRSYLAVLLIFLTGTPLITNQAHADTLGIDEIITLTVNPVLKKYNIPGMAVAVTVYGNHYFYNYGVLSLENNQPVTSQTLFEIGSLSKIFITTLATYMHEQGTIDLKNSVETYLPNLYRSYIGSRTLINLATDTLNGLPFSLPASINNQQQLMMYFKNWQPTFAQGTYRSYSQLSTGLLAIILSQQADKPFDILMDQTLFPRLGLHHTFINIPQEYTQDYAQGYSRTQTPIRLNPKFLTNETEAVKSSASDLIYFIDANMQLIPLNSKMIRAINETHTGYYQSGTVIQSFAWEQYPYPVSLETLLVNNSDYMHSEIIPATELHPPLTLQQTIYMNQSGSTEGFASYIAFIPDQKTGIIILTNQNIPMSEQTLMAHEILTEIAKIQ